MNNDFLIAPFDCLPELDDNATNLLLLLPKRELERCICFNFYYLFFLMCFYQRRHCYSYFQVRQAGWMGFVRPFRDIFEGYGITLPDNWGRQGELAMKIRNYLFNNGGRDCNTIILHVPHSSTKIPDISITPEIRDKCMEMARPLIDYYTDELFVPENYGQQSSQRMIAIVFEYCRFFCDVERLEDDPLEAKGQGIIHRMPTDSLNRSFELSSADRNMLLSLYDQHQNSLSSLDVFFDDAIVIDCHSFSSLPNELMPDAEKYENIDICIGFNNDGTKPQDFVISSLMRYYRGLGYNVALNKPFSNSKCLSKTSDTKTIMIEVNKNLYMNESTLEKNENFSRVKNDIQGMYRLLMKPLMPVSCFPMIM